MRKYKYYLTLISLLLLTLTTFNNCGSSKSSSSTQASREVPTDPNDPSVDGSISNCNSIGANTVGVDGPVSTYYDPNTKTFVEDLIRVKFNEAPLELVTTSNHYIQIFRWHENTPGSPVYNTTPVDIYFIVKNSGAQLQEDPVRELSKGTIQKLIQDNNLNVTPDKFFQSVILILDGMDITWDAMTIALYDAPRAAPIDFVNVLLPAFSANPNEYAKDHLAESLRALHPMWSYRNSSYTDEDFYAFTSELCVGF